MKVFFDIITNHTADVLDYPDSAYVGHRAGAVRDQGRGAVQGRLGQRVRRPRLHVVGDAFPAVDPKVTLPLRADLPDPVTRRQDARRGSTTRRCTTTAARRPSPARTASTATSRRATAPRSTTCGPSGPRSCRAWRTSTRRGWRRPVSTASASTPSSTSTSSSGSSSPPRCKGYAADVGQRRLLHVRRGVRRQPGVHVALHDRGQAPGDGRLRLPGQRRRPTRKGRADDRAAQFFAGDDWYTDADSNAYSLPTFLGNHDMGRIGQVPPPGRPRLDRRRAAPARRARPRAHVHHPGPAGRLLRRRAGLLGHRATAATRTRAGHVRLARSPATTTYDLIGTNATTARRQLRHVAPALRASSRPSRTCARSTPPSPTARRSTATPRAARASSPSAGSTPDKQVEYVVAANSADTTRTAHLRHLPAGTQHPQGVWPASAHAQPQDRRARDRSRCTVPPLSAVVYRATAKLRRRRARARAVVHRPRRAGHRHRSRQVGVTCPVTTSPR